MAKMTIAKLLVVFVSSLLDTVNGYYCDSDRCLDEEFCCGENICCVSYKVWELWYFWCGLLFCLFLLCMCACFWRERSRVYWVFRTPAAYSPLNPGSDTTYSTSRSDQYITGEESVSKSSYYSTTEKGPSWYSAHSSETDDSHDTSKSSVY